MQQATDSSTPAARGTVRRHSARTVWFGLFAIVLTFASALGLTSSRAGAAGGPSSVTVRAFEYNADGTTGAALSNFTFVVNLDNSPSPDNPNPLLRPGTAPIPSHSPVVAEGDQSHTTVSLPSNQPFEKYLVTVRSPDHMMWGQYIVADGSAKQVDVALKPTPLPTGKLVVHVYQDSAWTNGAPDSGEGGLAGFKVTLDDQIDGQVVVDYNNQPLCGGSCITDANGDVTISNLSPATYFIYAAPPVIGPYSDMVQTTTIDGSFAVLASVTPGDDGLGAPGETIWEGPGATTAWDFGFVHSGLSFAAPGTGTVTGTARNWVGWAPFDTLTLGDPVPNPYVALTDSTSDTTVYVGRGDANGNFTIQGVPDGTYNVSLWDEQLSYIMRFTTVTVSGGLPVDMGDVGVSRWFGWLSGYVYQDTGVAYDGTTLPAGTALNGIRDCTDPNDWTTCEPGIANFPMDQRWRDGSIKEDTVTRGLDNPYGPGYYEYPQAEGGPLGKFIIGEVGFDRFGTEPGASVHNELDPTQVHHVCAAPVNAAPADCTSYTGGGLLTSQLLSEGHRASVDWGKRPYKAGEAGQIVGITYYATTRNEFGGNAIGAQGGHPYAHETYEPAIPDVEVRLEGLGPDGLPNTADDTILNDYVTDHWQHPSAATDGQTCGPIKDAFGNDITTLLNPNLGPNCLETPLTGQQTKDGAFDGGYAFADYCPESRGGLDIARFKATGESKCNDAGDPQPLDPCLTSTAAVPGCYITHVIVPKDSTDTRPCNDATHTYVSDTHPIANVTQPQAGCLYRTEAEEDVNVDLGANFQPAIPPPPCTGDAHTIDTSTLTSRSPFSPSSPQYNGITREPLCDKVLIDLKAKQNANADFFLMTNFPNGKDVAPAGRVVGAVFDDIVFDRDVKSIWYGEPKPLQNIPIGIYDHNFRLLTTLNTDTNGHYEAMMPSTETFNCPIPQGPCPGMYVVIVDDPGTKAHPNLNYNPDYLTATTAFDIWPGQTTQLDTPIDPVSGTACELTSGTPELLQVSTPYLVSGGTGTARRITISGVNFGATAGTITLADSQSRALSSRTFTGLATSSQLSNANVGGIVSWIDRQIVIQVPNPHAATLLPPLAPFFPGQYQLMITDATAAGGLTIPNGITLHVLGSVGTNVYTPPVVNVAAPTLDGHELQTAINGAAANSLVVLAAGVYRENVIVWKPLKLQGLGPGGTIGILEPGGPPIEDPRFNIQGTTIDGKYYRENEAYWNTTLAGLSFNGYGNPADAPGTSKADLSRGAGITVLAQSAGALAFGSGLNAAKIDGIGVEGGQGSSGPGGLYVNAYARNLKVTNDVFASDHGTLGGGINLGVPYHGSQHNDNVQIKWTRVQGSGGFLRGGGVLVFNGADGYEVGNSMICANSSIEYGAGISQWGKSPNGSIHDNQIIFNSAVDSGAGISIAEEKPAPNQPAIPWNDARRGTGPVDILRNNIHGNMSGDDGGGIMVMNALTARVNIVDNLITNNGAQDLGGAVMLDDASNVAFVNNTLSMNATTASSETSDHLKHGAGLSSEGNDPGFQAILPAGSPDFANPVALFNNIFWQNEACTINSSQVPPALVGCNGELNDPAATYIDFEIHGVTGSRTYTNARYNLFTNGNVLQFDRSVQQLPGSTTAPATGFPNNPATAGNIIGVAPGFVNPLGTQFAVAPSRLDPQRASVTITQVDPPVGVPSNYHLLSGPPNLAANQVSGAVDRGVRCSNTAVPPPAPTLLQPFGPPCSAGAVEAPLVDVDNANRPQVRTLRLRTLWDFGADEVPTLGG